MNGAKTLSPERVAEIKAFKNTDFTDCPILTSDELKQMRPRHPERFNPVKQTADISSEMVQFMPA
ncbi:MAG: hypothetical protein LBH44_01455 [Treponema sp.]|jgi:hypothetical protein|nr:hypothetical protein [Treponema sp.]